MSLRINFPLPRSVSNTGFFLVCLARPPPLSLAHVLYYGGACRREPFSLGGRCPKEKRGGGSEEGGFLTSPRGLDRQVGRQAVGAWSGHRQS